MRTSTHVRSLDRRQTGAAFKADVLAPDTVPGFSLPSLGIAVVCLLEYSVDTIALRLGPHRSPDFDLLIR